MSVTGTLTDDERREWDVDPERWPATPPLHVFRALMAEDDNTWWRAGSGHGLNAYEATVDALEAAERERDEWKGQIVALRGQQRAALRRAESAEAALRKALEAALRRAE